MSIFGFELLMAEWDVIVSVFGFSYSVTFPGIRFVQ
jgi:hypothetical protein